MSSPRSPDHLPERIRAASALRALGHAVVGNHLDARLLDEIAEQARQWAQRATGYPRRRRARDGYLRDLELRPPLAGEPVRHFADCPVSGEANPLSIISDATREGDGVVVRARLGVACEGAPGRAHGGIVAAIFDDVMGFVTVQLRAPAYQGELTVWYREPTPIETELEIRAWPTERRRRQLVVEASISAEDRKTAHARGVHVLVTPDRLVPRR